MLASNMGVIGVTTNIGEANEPSVPEFKKVSQEDKDLLRKIKVDTRYKTTDVTATKNTSFEDFYLHHDLMLGIYEAGWDMCSPVQEASIPVILSGRDCLARAKNGTGKTGSYAVPMLQNLDFSSRKVQAIVLVPARELAMQTSSVIKELSKHMGGPQKQKVACMITTGGTSLRDDILRLQSDVHIIVATIGRLVDLASRNVADLSGVKLVIMDEADKLLSVEMVSQCEDIISRCHPDKQLCLFSATFPLTVDEFKLKHMKNPQQINLMDKLTLEGVTQFYAFVEERQKLHCLNTLLLKLEINQCIIFCNNVNRVEVLARKLAALGFPCYYIHSKMPQDKRNRIFHEFRTEKAKYLVSSDLCTRGIDVAGLNVVINFDFPYNSETYLHRIGRSGRYGHLGVAINLLTFNDRIYMFRVEEELNTRIECVPPNIDTSLYT